jgi:hypothetical protein
MRFLSRLLGGTKLAPEYRGRVGQPSVEELAEMDRLDLLETVEDFRLAAVERERAKAG